MKARALELESHYQILRMKKGSFAWPLTSNYEGYDAPTGDPLPDRKNEEGVHCLTFDL